MPIVAPEKTTKVLVSGSNGYIAIWVVNNLLQKGYAVRGTVRSEDKGTHLKKIFADYGDKFELAVVPDIVKEGAFDEAVQGVDAIEHTASPFHFKAKEPQELIDPAVKGTLGILESALKYGSGVRRIVITSSCAAVAMTGTTPKICTEQDWNDEAVDIVEKEGSKASSAFMYRASKTLAERAAWGFYEKHKSSLNWDLVVLNPPLVLGPVMHEVSAPSSLNTSMADFYNTVILGTKAPELLLTGLCWVDVRDLAEAHVLALVKEGVQGERIIVSAGPYVWQDWMDCANSLSPSPIPSHPNLPKGLPGSAKDVTHMVLFSADKGEKLLGIKYHTMEEMTRDSLKDFEQRGW
ncbi:NAD(P)-binding protein [Gymnopus androsaceus JB14]|uniref:NAD(P)-binding protein n=1 Tax=Gymnopus androsaceus JB14 TaxID=1447944 RepID=A0A6A4ISP1_9AGAR|nr:NAD(P)-binding protein [Gymnopus androsaceus JB14]